MRFPSLTTILDLLGAVLVILGLSLFVAQFLAPAGFVVGGLGLTGLSWLIDRQKGGNA